MCKHCKKQYERIDWTKLWRSNFTEKLRDECHLKTKRSLENRKNDDCASAQWLKLPHSCSQNMCIFCKDVVALSLVIAMWRYCSVHITISPHCYKLVVIYLCYFLSLPFLYCLSPCSKGPSKYNSMKCVRTNNSIITLYTTSYSFLKRWNFNYFL